MVLSFFFQFMFFLFPAALAGSVFLSALLRDQRGGYSGADTNHGTSGNIDALYELPGCEYHERFPNHRTRGLHIRGRGRSHHL